MAILHGLGDNVWFIDSGTAGYMTMDKKLIRKIAIIKYLAWELNEEEFNKIINNKQNERRKRKS